MTKALAVALLALGVSCSLQPASAAVLTVDGDLSDWGFLVADNNASTFVPNPSLNLLGIMVEDQDDLSGDDFNLGPWTGGQNFDAEMLAAAIQGDRLFIAISTGQRPDNGQYRFAPADIRIDTATTTYGIEVGGGVGGGPGSAITAGAPGSTYTIDGDGMVDGMISTPGSQQAGTIWTGGWFNWWQQLRNPGGTLVGTADYIYTLDSVTTQHAIIELSLPLSIFGGAEIVSISWGPACMNDLVEIFPPPVPEPSTWALAGCGLAGLAVMAARRRRAR